MGNKSRLSFKEVFELIFVLFFIQSNTIFFNEKNISSFFLATLVVHRQEILSHFRITHIRLLKNKSHFTHINRINRLSMNDQEYHFIRTLTSNLQSSLNISSGKFFEMQEQIFPTIDLSQKTHPFKKLFNILFDLDSDE